MNIRVDTEVKEKVEQIFQKLGLSLSEAINLFLRAVIMENGIPFPLTLNDTTTAAVEEGRNSAADISAHGYLSMDELKDILENDDESLCVR